MPPAFAPHRGHRFAVEQDRAFEAAVELGEVEHGGNGARRRVDRLRHAGVRRDTARRSRDREPPGACRTPLKRSSWLVAELPAIVGRCVLDVLRGDRVEHGEAIEDLLAERLPERHQIFLDADLGDAGERRVTARVVCLKPPLADRCVSASRTVMVGVRRRHRALLDAIVQAERGRFPRTVRESTRPTALPSNLKCDTACRSARESDARRRRSRGRLPTRRARPEQSPPDIPGMFGLDAQRVEIALEEREGQLLLGRRVRRDHNGHEQRYERDSDKANHQIGAGNPGWDHSIRRAESLVQSPRFCVTFSAIQTMFVTAKPLVTSGRRTADIWIVRGIPVCAVPGHFRRDGLCDGGRAHRSLVRDDSVLVSFELTDGYTPEVKDAVHSGLKTTFTYTGGTAAGRAGVGRPDDCDLGHHQYRAIRQPDPARHARRGRSTATSSRPRPPKTKRSCASG